MKLILLTLFLFKTICAQCLMIGIQTSTIIQGKVVNKLDGEVLIGANVFLKSNLTTGGTTDIDGNFKLTLEASNFNDTIVVSYIGYDEEFVAIKLTQTTNLVIELTPTSFQTEEITITAEKLVAEEFSIKKLKKLDIYINPNAKADPLLAVNSLPSSSTTDESANISLRGSAPAETGIFFNHVPIYDAVKFSQLNGIGTFSIFNTSLIKSLHVFPGNPPLEYGNATSGLISLQTDEHIPKTNLNSLGISLANIGGNLSKKLNNSSSLILFANYQPSFIIKSLNPKALNNLKKFQSGDMGIHYYKKLNANSSLKVFNYSMHEGYNFKFLSPSYEGAFKQRKSRNFTIINYRKLIKEKSEVTLNGGYSFSKGNFNYSIYNIDLQNNDLYLAVNYQFFSKHIGLKSGISFDHRRSEFDGTIPTYQYALGEDYPSTYQKATETIRSFEYYIYLKYFLNRRITIGSGLRKNIPLDNQKNYLSSQLNVNFLVTTKLSLNLSGGQYHKYYFSQNEYSPQFLSSSQLSADLKYHSGKMESSLAIFYKRGTQSRLANKIKGVELYLKYQLTQKLNGKLSYTFLDTEVIKDKIKYPSKYDLNYFFKGNIEYKTVSLWTFNMLFLFRQGTYYFPVLEAEFEPGLQVYQPVYADQTKRIRYPDYKLVDMSISKLLPISEEFSIIFFGSINNIFNFKNIRSYTYSFNYQQKNDLLFSQRVIYFGGILNF